MEINGCSFQQDLRQKFELVFVLAHFQNGTPLERSACAYVTITGKFFFNTLSSKQIFYLINENLFHKKKKKMSTAF